MQQDVAVQVNGEDVTVCPQLREDKRDEAGQAALCRASVITPPLQAVLAPRSP